MKLCASALDRVSRWHGPMLGRPDEHPEREWRYTTDAVDSINRLGAQWTWEPLYLRAPQEEDT